MHEFFTWAEPECSFVFGKTNPKILPRRIDDSSIRTIELGLDLLPRQVSCFRTSIHHLRGW
jgi:hypothetical protein